MSQLIVLGFNDNASAQAARNVLRQAEPSRLTILDEKTVAPFEQLAASNAPVTMPLLVRVPLAMFVGFFAGIYFGAKWFSQTMGAVSNFLIEPQTKTNVQAQQGRVVLLIDDALTEKFVNEFKQLGASVQQLTLTAEEEGQLRSKLNGQPSTVQSAAAMG